MVSPCNNCGRLRGGQAGEQGLRRPAPRPGAGDEGLTARGGPTKELALLPLRASPGCAAACGATHRMTPTAQQAPFPAGGCGALPGCCFSRPSRGPGPPAPSRAPPPAPPAPRRAALPGVPPGAPNARHRAPRSSACPSPLGGRAQGWPAAHPHFDSSGGGWAGSGGRKAVGRRAMHCVAGGAGSPPPPFIPLAHMLTGTSSRRWFCEGGAAAQRPPGRPRPCAACTRPRGARSNRRAPAARRRTPGWPPPRTLRPGP